MKDVRNSTRVHTHNIIMEKIMSTRIGITLEDEIYNKYKEILFKEKKNNTKRSDRIYCAEDTKNRKTI